MTFFLIFFLLWRSHCLMMPFIGKLLKKKQAKKAKVKIAETRQMLQVDYELNELTFMFLFFKEEQIS